MSPASVRPYSALLALTLCAITQAVAANPTPPALNTPALNNGTQLAPLFASGVDRRLNIPETEVKHYGDILLGILKNKKISDPQYIVLVDRCENIQALLIYWLSPQQTVQFIGASPVSTGRPGTFDHSKTPLGVFEHSTDNPDFRAQGTKNENGIRGYGLKGMRVYDFGWQKAIKGWRYKDEFDLRLQMHATDPILERRIGSWQSKGCVRIPASLNRFIDNHAVLDGDYEKSMSTKGTVFWVLHKDRMPTPWSGRFMVVIDTERSERPAWSPHPLAKTPAPGKVTGATSPGNRTHAPDAPENRTAVHSTPRI